MVKWVTLCFLRRCAELLIPQTWVVRTGLRLLQGSTRGGAVRRREHGLLNAYFGSGPCLRALGITRPGLFGESCRARAVVTGRARGLPDS
jgi:hypothetical protein